MPRTSIDVCICTYRRESIVQTLESIAAQKTTDEVVVRMIVADNDDQPSAAARIAKFAEEATIQIQYIHAPAHNISLARNACLEAASADWIAFIDDDETAASDWLMTLLQMAEKEALTAVFGPAHARYNQDAPDWITGRDYHSNFPERRNGTVETGHTCNALLRRNDPAVMTERFLLSKGLTGGEDTEFFFRVGRNGGRFGICDTAKVYEQVDPARVNFQWLAQRKFRYGQSYGYHSAGDNTTKRVVTTLKAVVKVLFCVLMALVFFWSTSRRNFWLLRGLFHVGVLSSFFGLVEKELY